VKLRPGPVAALVCLVGFAGYAYFKDYRGAEDRQKTEENKDRPLVFERANIKAIALQGKTGVIRLERFGDDWRITQPLDTAADRDAVEGLLTTLESGHIDRRLGEVKDRKTYGLDPPASSLTIETISGPSQSVALGDQAPIGGAWFALLGAKEVAVVSAPLGEAASKDLLSLRDKTLLAFDPFKVKGLTLVRGKETITLEKPAEGWKVVQPFDAPADGPAISDLLSALERIRATAFVKEKAAEPDLKALGFEPPAVRVTLLQEGWDTTKTIEFGSETDGKRNARAVGKDAVIAILPDFWSKLQTPVTDLRRKEILGLSQYRIRSVTATRGSDQPLVLTKGKESNWTAGGRATGEVKYDSVDKWLRSLGDIKAVAWGEKPDARAATPPSEKPPLDLTLEEEPDSEGGTPRRQHLVFGPAGKDKHVPVKDTDWKSVMLVDADPVTRLYDGLEGLAKEAASAAATTPATGAATAPATPPAGTRPPAGDGKPPR
jgi:hypothetical protein